MPGPVPRTGPHTGKHDVTRTRLAAPALLSLALMAALPLHAARPIDRAESVPATIHAIQGNELASPLSGSTVVTEGIVTARTADGYFIQSPDGAGDGQSNTSEGLYVHLGASPGAAATVGNRVRVTGTVAEFRPALQPHQLPLTRLESVTAQLVLATAQPLPAAQALPPGILTPAADIAALEPFEGMRVSVPELVVVGAAGAIIDETSLTAQSDGVVHAIVGTDVTYANLPLRGPGLPLLDASTPPAGKTLPVFDGNPQVLRVDSRAQPGAPLLDLGYDDMIFGAVGVLGQAGGRYSLLIDPVSPMQVANGYRGEGAASQRPGEIKLSWLDLGRLFDAGDDPSRAEPVPNPAGYQARLAKLASGLCTLLANPEIIAVSGAENIQVLRDLAAVIETNPSSYCPGTMAYQAVLTEGQDPSGLDIGFLLMGAVVDSVHPRVELLEAEQIAAGDTSAHPAGGSELLFTQPPLRATLRLTDAAGRQADLTAVVAKFRELDGADSPAPGGNGWATQSERLMNLRARQAARLAAWLQARQLANPDEAIAVLGGFEADAFNDGRVDVVGIVTGRPAPANQTWVAMPSPVTAPLDSLTSLAPGYTRYNANDRGDFRALDHILVNGPMRAKFAITPMHPRVNADFPASQRYAGGNSITWGARDPLIARLAVAQFTDADTHLSFIAAERPSSRADTIAYFGVGNLGPDTAPALEVRITSSLAPSRWSLSTQYPGWTCGAIESDGTGSLVRCANTGIVATDNHALEILIPADLTLDGQTVQFTGTLTGTHNDPDTSNNQATGSIAFNNNTDVKVAIQGIGQEGDLMPGQPDGFVVAVTRTPANPPGPTTVVATIDAPAAEVSIGDGYGQLNCGAGVDIGPRRSRFTCAVSDTNVTELAIFSVNYLTGLGDGGRVIGLTVEATPTTREDTPLDNIDSRSRRVSDAVDLVVTEPGLSPDPARLDEPLRMYMLAYNTVEGVARNARVEIDVDVPPAVLGPFTVTPYYSTVAWTCGAPQAAAGGSRVVCRPPPLLLHDPLRNPLWVFASGFTPDFRPGLANYPVTVVFTAFSDSEERNAADNTARFTTVVDQTTDLAAAVSTASQNPVAEPGVAAFDVQVLATGTNAPRNPRVALELDATVPVQDLWVISANQQTISCSPLSAPAGRTRLDCPAVNVNGQAFRVNVRTRPALANTTLTLTATVRNDLVDSQPGDNAGSASVDVIAVADLCVGPSCENGGGTVPRKIDAGPLNTLRYAFRSFGPSTARGAVATIDIALPPARVSARAAGQACAAAVGIGGGVSRIACALGDLPGDSITRELELDVFAGDLPISNVALSIELASAVTDPQPSNNRIEYTLPVAPLMDLSLAITAKAANYPVDATFVLTAAAAGPPNVALSEIFIQLKTPGNEQPARIAGPGWNCGLLNWFGTTQEYGCVRTSPLSGGVPAPVVMTVPTAGFLQIGSDIRILAEHFYRPDALAHDKTGANNLVDHVLRVGGRSTKSLRTPAYGAKPATPRAPAGPARKPLN